MKRPLISLLLLLLITACIPEITSAQVNNQIKWIHPTPQGNDLYWIKRWDANNWYACGDRATFMKTTNGGNTWTVLNNIFKGNGSTSLYDGYFSDMNTGLLCGRVGKVLKTTNGGTSWDTSGAVISSGIVWTGMHFLNSSTGFISGNSPSTIAKTTDGGATWDSLPGGISTNYFDVYAKDTSNIILASLSGNIRKTTNGGQNWSTISTGIAGSLQKVNFLNSNTGYVVSLSGKVSMTTNFGSSWTNMTGSLPNTPYLDIDFVNISSVDYVYITGNPTNIYRAPVGTTSWDTVQILAPSQTISSRLYSTDMSVTGDTLITTGNYGLINARYSPSNRKSYTNILKTGTMQSIWAESTNGRVITAGSPTTSTTFDQVMYSTNGGTDWQIANFPNTDDGGMASLSMVNSLTGYTTGTNGNVFKTTDGGENWTELTSPLLFSMPGAGRGASGFSAISFPDVNTGYVFGDGSFKTTNGGINWTPYVSGHGSSYIYGSYFINSNTGWTGGDDGLLYKTTNGGATVTAQNSGMTGTINSIQMMDANTGWFAGDDGNLRKTTNGGASWDSVAVPVSSTLESVYFIDPLNGMVTVSGGDVLRTRDGGNSWEILNTPRSTANCVYMTATNRAFLCGANSGVWRYEETMTGTELTFTNEVPSEYHLEQNYPNPFNPSTTIKFALPEQGTVSLKIFDIAGREAASLLDNAELNRGTFEQRFDGSGLASGVYFYSLAVDGQTVSTKKMMLVK